MDTERTAIDTWGERLAVITEAMVSGSHLLSNLAFLPADAGQTSDSRLAALNRVWRLLVGPGESLEDRCQRLHNDLGPPWGEGAASALRKVLQAIDGEIRRLVQAGASDPLRPLVRTADFGEPVLIQREPGSAIAYVVGLLDRLPDDHRLRGVLPADELYRHDGRPAWVLGLATKGFPNGFFARPYYDLADVVPLTREWVRPQREDRERREGDRQRELADAERRRQNDPLTRIQGVEGQLAELRSQGEGEEDA